MKRLLKFIAVMIAACSVTPAPAQVRFYGNTHLEYARNESDDVELQSPTRRDFYDHWTEANLQYRDFRVGARLGIHNAPPIFATDQSIRRAALEQRFIEYSGGNLEMRLGHFYHLFDRGLVLRFFENRQLRYDTRIDGFKFDYRHSKFDAKFIIGQPINRQNQRQELFQAANLALKPSSLLHFGGTLVTTNPEDRERVYWGSAFSQISFKYGSFYGEYALESDDNTPSGAGRAWYLNANWFLSSFSLLFEYKDYDRFEQFEGAFFNNPPLVAREHLFTLLNRHQLIQNANDERGFLIEGSYPIIDDGILTAHYSNTDDREGNRIYQEYFGQFDWTTSFDWEIIWAASRQEDPSARYLTFVNSTSFELSDYNSVKIVFEHQHTRKLLNDQQFYSQAIAAGFSHAPAWTISFLGERTTEQNLKNDIWAALQLDLSLSQRFDLSLIAGSRRKGKVCVGGVCVIKPELEGVELTVISRF